MRLSRKAEAALTRRLLEQMPAQQGHPAAVSAPPRKGGGGVLARSGAYRFRRQLIPVGWLAVVLAAGPGFHHAGKPQDGLLTGLAGALAVFLGSRHLKGRSKAPRVGAGAPDRDLGAGPVLDGDWRRPWPFLAVLSWAVLQGFWSHHYRWRPEEPEPQSRRKPTTRSGTPSRPSGNGKGHLGTVEPLPGGGPAVPDPAATASRPTIGNVLSRQRERRRGVAQADDRGVRRA